MGRDLDFVWPPKLEAGDDAGVKESLLWPEGKEWNLVPPAVLAEQQMHLLLQLVGDRFERSCDLGGGECLRADEQPIGWVLDQCLRTTRDRELFGWNVNLAEEARSFDTAGFEKREGFGVATKYSQPLARPCEGARESEADRPRSPDRNLQMAFIPFSQSGIEGLVLHGFARTGSQSMFRIGLWAVCIGLTGWMLAAVAPQPRPFRMDLDLADPATRLSAVQREAAKLLGEANRLVRIGSTDEARQALGRVKGTPALAGYTELVRVQLLMKEGRHADAHRVAGHAIDLPGSDALRAALGVLQGEALAMGGDASGAELAWTSVLAQPAAKDEAIRNSIQLSIIASRQRTGSLDPTLDPRILLDQNFPDVAIVSPPTPTQALPSKVVLSRAREAFKAGRTERAIELFDEAIAGDLDARRLRAAKMGRARTLFQARRYESALKAFDALLPEVEARFWRARSLARLGDIEGSLEEFDRVSQGSNEEFASWALYLMGTLHDDRNQTKKAIDVFRRAAQYKRYPDRVRATLWRKGWLQYRSGAHADSRETFSDLVPRVADPLEQLRPRYWSNRAAMLSNDEEAGLVELEQVARDFPLTYYGWRAQERLSLAGAGLVDSERNLADGTRRVDDEAIERITLLIEADLDDLARDELRFAARRARGFFDRTRVGALLVRVGDFNRAHELVVIAYADSLARGVQKGREALWWLSWPPAYRGLIDEVLPRGAVVEPELVSAIMREESRYRVDARSPVGALGLLQLMPDTASKLAAEQGLEAFETEDLFDPRTNIMLGSAYLAQLGERFDGRMSAAIGSYNAGPHKVAAWLQGEGGQLEDDVWVENIPYDQTRRYVKRVLRSLHVYKVFY
jgi:soluble lytic murein transglycosylase